MSMRLMDALHSVPLLGTCDPVDKSERGAWQILQSTPHHKWRARGDSVPRGEPGSSLKDIFRRCRRIKDMWIGRGRHAVFNKDSLAVLIKPEYVEWHLRVLHPEAVILAHGEDKEHPVPLWDIRTATKPPLVLGRCCRIVERQGHPGKGRGVLRRGQCLIEHEHRDKRHYEYENTDGMPGHASSIRRKARPRVRTGQMTRLRDYEKLADVRKLARPTQAPTPSAAKSAKERRRPSPNSTRPRSCLRRLRPM